MSIPAQGAVGAETMTDGETVTILYTNWRGETAIRRIVPGSEHPGFGALWLGETEWHPGIQWLLAARDVEKDAHRVFALSGIKAWGQAAVDAALATPRTDSDEGTAGDILSEACKPWELCFGVPPEYDSPLHGVFVSGMIYTERLLADLLNVPDYEHGDGSEDFDADATQSLRNILIGASLWDADENRPATPAPATPPGVPDSVRALSEAVIAASAVSTVERLENAAVGGLFHCEADREEAVEIIAEAIRAASHPAGQSEGGPERCEICDKPLIAGQRVMQDVELGTVHAACCGPEREAYVKDVETGESLGPNDPIPQGYIYEPERAAERCAPNAGGRP